MYLVAVTGGIGSGKSTVSARLAHHGAEVIDLDEVAREIVQPGEPALEEIAARFGQDVVQADGTLDRAELARRAFVDDDSRRDLDRITHPRVASRIAERLTVLAAEAHADPARIIVVDHPLLIETGQAGRFDAVVAVLADETLRIERLVERRGLDAEDVRARMRQQVDDEARRAAADHVVTNEGDLDTLNAEVDRLQAHLAAKAREQRALR